MLKIILISTSILMSPLAFGCGDKTASNTSTPATAQFSGCANEGANCNAQTPCCGDNSCVRGRCQFVPPENSVKNVMAKQVNAGENHGETDHQ